MRQAVQARRTSIVDIDHRAGGGVVVWGFHLIDRTGRATSPMQWTEANRGTQGYGLEGRIGGMRLAREQTSGS